MVAKNHPDEQAERAKKERRNGIVNRLDGHASIADIVGVATERGIVVERIGHNLEMAEKKNAADS